MTNQQWTKQKKQNWFISLIFGCRQQQEAYITHLQHLECVIQELTAKNNTIKAEFDSLKVDYRKLREENFTIKIDIAQKEKQLEEMTEAMDGKTIITNKEQQVVKPKKRVSF
jgi:hypothetical protein